MLRAGGSGALSEKLGDLNKWTWFAKHPEALERSLELGGAPVQLFADAHSTPFSLASSRLHHKQLHHQNQKARALALSRQRSRRKRNQIKVDVIGGRKRRRKQQPQHPQQQANTSDSVQQKKQQQPPNDTSKANTAAAAASAAAPQPANLQSKAKAKAKGSAGSTASDLRKNESVETPKPVRFTINALLSYEPLSYKHESIHAAVLYISGFTLFKALSYCTFVRVRDPVTYAR